MSLAIGSLSTEKQHITLARVGRPCRQHPQGHNKLLRGSSCPHCSSFFSSSVCSSPSSSYLLPLSLLSDPTYKKLDRVLMTTEWELKYPLVTVHALDRGVSNHAPLLLETGDPAFSGHPKQFKMELNWLSYQDFQEKEILIQPVVGQNSVQRWNRKIGALRKHQRGQARHPHGVYKA